MNPLSTHEQLHQYLDQKEYFLDQFIDSGSDQELFVASYIHGHFSVIAANIVSVLSQANSQDYTFEQYQQSFVSMLSTSVQRAIDNNELDNKDAEQVINMLDSMFTEK